MDKSIVIEDIQICSYRNALYLRGPLLTHSEEHYKHRKLQKGDSQENQLCMTLSPIPNTWNKSAWLINTSVLLYLQCDWFGPRTTETEQWRYIKPRQSRKKEISVSLCTKLFVLRISEMGYRCT